ncbi:O-antigen ligase family protein [Vibrio intestinalis]|uniref:O-antigen ligase family protein n=1 Tax=Vibrio intestinalis TaxID=2933291 RepID=UPI0021A96524|nr:O-antigen ligase family protein [Vibrio intestinalis]
MKDLVNSKILFLLPLFGAILTLPYSDMNGVVVVCLALGLIYGGFNWRTTIEIKPVLFAWLGFTVWYACSLLWTEHPELVYNGLRKEVLYSFAGLVLGYIVIAKLQIWRAVFWTMLLSGVLFSLLLVAVEYLSLFGEGFQRFIDKQDPGVGDSSTLLVLFACFGLFIFKLKDLSKASFTLFIAYELILSYSMILTRNRMGIVCIALIAVLLALYLAKSLPRAWKVLLLLAVVPLSIGVVYKGFATKSNYQGSVVDTIVHVSENDARVWMWKYYGAKALDQPLKGYGAGYTSPKEHFDDHPPYFNILTKMHSHNVLMNKVLQLGFIGLALFLVLYFSPFMMRDVRKDKNAQFILFTFLSVFMFKSMTDDFFIRNSLILYWLIIGMILALNNIEKKEAS